MAQVPIEAYNNIIRNFPGRQGQIDLLLRLFRRPQDPVPCLFLYGATGSGKTLLMREMMKLIGARYCLVNSLECYSQRLLYESALNQLDQESILKNKTCAELSRFVTLLDQLLAKELNTTYLIFDKAERLRGEFQFIVNALLRLTEQTNRNICVIFLSRVSFDEFRDDSGSPEPISIHFLSYNKDHIQEIILLDSNSIFNHANTILNLPEELAQHLENLLHNFVSLVLDVFFNACSDLSELHHIVELLFPKYLQPIMDDKVKPTEILILYNRIRPYLQEVLKSLSLREISFSDLIKKTQDDPNAKKNVVDLPLSAKYILIASYLASYNNPKYDKQIFGTSHVGKATKARRNKNAKEKLQQQFEGPKAFQLNRMLAIYTSIAKGDEDQQDTITTQYVSPTTAQIFTQISSLVGLKLLALDSAASFNLDKAKYKCCVDLDYIEAIANSINFKLYNFLLSSWVLLAVLVQRHS